MSAPTPTPLASMDALITERDALRSQATQMGAAASRAQGAERRRLLHERRQLDARLAQLNRRIKEVHDVQVRVPPSLWRAVARAADEFLFGDSDDDHAGDELEEALAALDRADPDWRHR